MTALTFRARRATIRIVALCCGFVTRKRYSGHEETIYIYRKKSFAVVTTHNPPGDSRKNMRSDHHKRFFRFREDFMNFKSELLAKVLAETKTQTRRPVKPDHHPAIERDTLEFMSPGTRYGDILAVRTFNDRTVYEIGKTYAACPGRGKKQQGRIEIVRLRSEDVRHISDEDVIAEGFTNVVEFLNVWMGFYDKKAYRQVMNDLFSDAAPEMRLKEIREYVFSRPAELYQAWVIDFKLVK